MVVGQHSAPTTISAGEKTHSEDKEWLWKRCARVVVKTFFFFTPELLNTTPILFCKQR
jgi:hypothetical protein